MTGPVRQRVGTAAVGHRAHHPRGVPVSGDGVDRSRIGRRTIASIVVTVVFRHLFVGARRRRSATT